MRRRSTISIGAAHILPHLYGRVLIPPAVLGELQADKTPPSMRAWMQAPPDWLSLHPVAVSASLETLGAGEREAILLAEQLGVLGLLLDEREARREATARGLLVVGTLRVLADAAAQGLIDLAAMLDRLAATNFRAAPWLWAWDGLNCPTPGNE